MPTKPDPHVSMPSPDLDPLFTSVTPITYPDQGGNATGFYFIDDAGDQYLITNHHVVSNQNDSLLADSIRVVVRPTPDVQDVEFHDIDLQVDNEKTWIEHPRGSHIDIVAIPLPFDITSKTTMALHSGFIPPLEGEMPFGQRAIIIGYPILEESPFLPIRRDAIVASLYGTSYRGLPCFVTDADMHSGSSGSPVFGLPTASARSGDLIGNDLQLIGIHSATLFSNHPPREGALDLNIAWYSQLLMDMIAIQEPTAPTVA